MSIAIVDTATRFVDLALKYAGSWNDDMVMQPGETLILLELVTAAGFNPRVVLPGRLRGNYRDEDGPTGKTYPINSLCPFIINNEEQKEDYFATGWLDCALRRVVSVFGLKPTPETREHLIGVIAEEIERSIPLTPIQLTAYGDFLSEYPPSAQMFGSSYFVEHSHEDDECTSCVGIHKFCGGWMDRKQTSNTHDALICRACHLRVVIPREARTYGDVRKTLTPMFQQTVPLGGRM